MSNKGWECPKCGRCFAPNQQQCLMCLPPFGCDGEWRLTLNRYQRDNLMWLLSAMGVTSVEGVPPFTLANTGGPARSGTC